MPDRGMHPLLVALISFLLGAFCYWGAVKLLRSWSGPKYPSEHQVEALWNDCLMRKSPDPGARMLVAVETFDFDGSSKMPMYGVTWRWNPTHPGYDSTVHQSSFRLSYNHEKREWYGDFVRLPGDVLLKGEHGDLYCEKDPRKVRMEAAQ